MGASLQHQRGRKGKRQAVTGRPDGTLLLKQRLAAGLFLGTLLLFGRSLGYPFVNYDDPQYVLQNPHVFIGLTVDNVRWALTTAHQSNWHPLTWLSLQLDATVYGGAAAWGYRLTNVVLHAVNAALLFWIWAAMTGAVWRSALVAALFAAHPLHVESVVWITERKDVLSTFFWLLAMAAYLRYARRPGLGSYLAVAAALALGLMVKPMLVTLPFVLLLLDYWPLGRWSQLGRRVAEKAPLLAVVVASVVITLHVQLAGGAVKGGEHYPLEDRLGNAVLSYVVYIFNAVWPAELAPFYPYVHHSLVDGVVIAAGVGLTLTTAVCARRRASQPYLLVGWLWYLGTLVPVIGLVQVGGQARADRYTYVPLIGLLVLAVWGLSDLLARWAVPLSRRVGVAAAGLGACVLLTWLQIGYWQSDVLLWSHTLEVTGEGNAIAQQNLGLALLDAGQSQDALPHLSAGADLDQNRSNPQVALAVCLLQLHREKEAIAPLSLASQLSPDDLDVHKTLGALLAGEGRDREAFAHFLALTPDDLAAAHLALGKQLLAGQWVAEARTQLQQAVALDPRRPEVQLQLALARLYEGRPAEAERPLREAARLDPASATALTLLGLVLSQQGRHAEAVASCRRAVALEPRSAANRGNLALALSAGGQAAEAQRTYAEAARLDSEWANHCLRSAWQAAVGGRPGLGLFLPRCHAREVCEATTFGDPQAILTLAAVEASDGRFAEALSLLQRARQQAERAGDHQLLRDIKEQRKLYQTGRSLRAPRPG
jgi:tetratricopeptide (TPR) repeat protein